MRPVKELKYALKHLEQLPDSPERQAQMEVIRNCHSEKKVFDLYVQKAEEKNESLFYAARDAAQFVAGKLELSTLLDTDIAETYTETEPVAEEVKEEKVTVSKAYLELLEQRLERLEVRLLKIEGIKSLVKEKEPNSLTSGEVCYYVGCSRDTLMRWTREGTVKAERRGKNYYYPVEELMENEVVRKFIRNKKKL